MVESFENNAQSEKHPTTQKTQSVWTSLLTFSLYLFLIPVSSLKLYVKFPQWLHSKILKSCSLDKTEEISSLLDPISFSVFANALPAWLLLDILVFTFFQWSKIVLELFYLSWERYPHCRHLLPLCKNQPQVHFQIIILTTTKGLAHITTILKFSTQH